jgi:DNA-binding transcriptional regulator LsrR (DeoR family)
MRDAGLTSSWSCEIPFTQQELGDVTGLSTVHVNRVLQRLRGEGLIVLSGDHITAPEWERLKEAGDFDPAYLHLMDPEAARAPLP